MANTDSLWSPERQPLLDALLDSPDIEAVLRLSVLEGAEGQSRIIAASVAIVESLPPYVMAHALADAKRRLRHLAGDGVEIFVEPDLVKDPSRAEPPTDVIVIRASD